MPDTTYRIIRWDVPVDDKPHTFSLSGDVVYVAARNHDMVTIWTLDTSPHLVNRTFQVISTGQPFPSGWTYIGTAVTPDGMLVWHLMELQ